MTCVRLYSCGLQKACTHGFAFIYSELVFPIYYDHRTLEGRAQNCLRPSRQFCLLLCCARPIPILNCTSPSAKYSEADLLGIAGVRTVAGHGGKRSRKTYHCQGPQSDNTVTIRSGFCGSFVLRWTAKLCGPSMPSCIINGLDSTTVLSPGLRTIEPMVSGGGQQPSTTSM
jgi:hypothetical protein